MRRPTRKTNWTMSGRMGAVMTSSGRVVSPVFSPVRENTETRGRADPVRRGGEDRRVGRGCRRCVAGPGPSLLRGGRLDVAAAVRLVLLAGVGELVGGGLREHRPRRGRGATRPPSRSRPQRPTRGKKGPEPPATARPTKRARTGHPSTRGTAPLTTPRRVRQRGGGGRQLPERRRRRASACPARAPCGRVLPPLPGAGACCAVRAPGGHRRGGRRKG